MTPIGGSPYIHSSPPDPYERERKEFHETMEMVISQLIEIRKKDLIKDRQEILNTLREVGEITRVAMENPLLIFLKQPFQTATMLSSDLYSLLQREDPINKSDFHEDITSLIDTLMHCNISIPH